MNAKVKFLLPVITLYGFYAYEMLFGEDFLIWGKFVLGAIIIFYSFSEYMHLKDLDRIQKLEAKISEFDSRFQEQVKE